MALVKPPASLSKIGRVCKIAQDYEQADGVICYYSRLWAIEQALKIDSKSPDANKFIASLMDYLEKAKKDNQGDKRYTEEAAGLAHVEQYALKLFAYAFKKDEEGDFGMDTVNSFLNAGTLLDVLSIREVSEEIIKARKYAKYKAVYITNCLKAGNTPVAGPLGEGEAGVAPAILTASDHSKPATKPVKQTSVPHSVHPPASNEANQEETEEASYEQCEKAIKSAKFGISSLQYKDRAGAIKFFQEAINILQKK